ncbi:hypothetical protein [Streptomyces sp. NPDC056264]|uniref:hypothetical protein n=1 Tax=Streptomyces sp. NPDC056264 TaxID=3345767 RepID=UPI003AAEE01E
MLRAGTVRAAWHGRRDGDLPLLRFLLEHENPRRTDWYRERRLAALLVAAPGGGLITEQHLELTLAAVEAGDANLAKAMMARA